MERWKPRGIFDEFQFRVKADVKRVQFGDPGWRLGYTRDDVRNLFPHPTDKKRVNPFIERTLEKDVTEGDDARGNAKSLQELQALVQEMRDLATDIDTVPGDERARIEGEIERMEKRIDLRAGELMQNALIEVFKKQRPGEPPTIDNSRKLFDTLFFDPKRYDLTRVGRYKLNSRLGLDIDPDVRVLTHRDLIELVRRVVRLPIMLGVDDPEIRDFAEACREIPRTEDVAREPWHYTFRPADC